MSWQTAGWDEACGQRSIYSSVQQLHTANVQRVAALIALAGTPAALPSGCCTGRQGVWDVAVCMTMHKPLAGALFTHTCKVAEDSRQWPQQQLL